MSSWIKCTCGKLLHMNLFAGASVSVVIKDDVLDSIDHGKTVEYAIVAIIAGADILVRCKECGRIAIEDRKTHAVTFYLPEVTHE